MKAFLIGRAKSLKYALQGMFLLLRTEHAIIAQSSISLLFIALGFYYGIDRMEWIVQTFLIGFILATESLNTAVEKVCDFIHPDYHERIGFIKDISAGAVAFAVLFSLAVAAMLYYPYIAASL
jgi:diacylglycerol kinase (ATP)